jgi:hypothetical protein
MKDVCRGRECFSLLYKPGFNLKLLKRGVKTPNDEAFQWCMRMLFSAMQARVKSGLAVKRGVKTPDEE